MIRPRAPLTLALALSTLFAAAPALAAGTATVKTGSSDGSMNIAVAWSDTGAVRIESPNEPVYTIVKDGAAYAVSMVAGTPMVMDLSAMMQTGAMGGGADPGAGLGLDSKTAASVETFRPTGTTETVAGIPGEVYEIAWTDHTGGSHVNEAVLSSDPLAREFAQAFLSVAKTLSQIEDARTAILNERGLGVLRYEDEFRLETISGAAPAAAAFDLPAPPMDLQQMLQSIMQQQQ